MQAKSVFDKNHVESIRQIQLMQQKLLLTQHNKTKLLGCSEILAAFYYRMKILVKVLKREKFGVIYIYVYIKYYITFI